MRWKHSKRGTTMVEVIVAFAVLILIMGIFSQAVTLTGRMMNRAEDTLKGYRSLAGDYYMDQIAPHTQSGELQFEDIKNGAEFKVPVTVRAFTDSAGDLYDVVMETSGGGEPPESIDPPPTEAPVKERPFVTVGGRAEKTIIPEFTEVDLINNVKEIEHKFLEFFNSPDWQKVETSDGKIGYYFRFVSNGEPHALWGWDEESTSQESLPIEGINSSARINIRNSSEVHNKTGAILEYITGNQIGGATNLNFQFKEGTLYIEQVSLIYRNSNVRIRYN